MSLCNHESLGDKIAGEVEVGLLTLDTVAGCHG